MGFPSTLVAAARNWRAITITIVVVAVALASLWYYLENPTNQMFGRTVTGVPTHQKVVALTFDDGPNPPYTDQIVTYLHEQHVTATFFVVGRAVAAHPDTVRLEVQDGDALGNHTWDHAHLVLERRAHIAWEIQQTDAAIKKATGIHTDLFRPPFGARDYAVISVARQMGYQVIMWNVPLAHDWQNPAPAVIADRIVKHVRDGSIIVLHDGNRGLPADRGSSVKATMLIVQALTKEGYTFVTVPQLLKLGYPDTRTASNPGQEY